MKKLSVMLTVVSFGIMTLTGCKTEKTVSSTTTKTTTTTTTTTKKDVNKKEAPAVAKIDCNAGITFTSTIKPIMEAKCVECHSGPKPAHRLDFTTIAGVQAGVGHNMMCTVTKGPCPKMPPGGREKMTPTEVQQLQCWIDNGMKN